MSDTSDSAAISVTGLKAPRSIKASVYEVLSSTHGWDALTPEQMAQVEIIATEIPNTKAFERTLREQGLSTPEIQMRILQCFLHIADYRFKGNLAQAGGAGMSAPMASDATNLSAGVHGGSCSPWFDPIPPELRDKALQRMDSGPEWLYLAGQEAALELVTRNHALLLSLGNFEPSLVHAYAIGPTGLYPVRELVTLFRLGNRERLREAGDPMPNSTDGAYTLFRGVAGKGPRRRVRGLSWTDDLDRAKWFANRYAHLEDPTVYRAVVHADEVYAYVNDRQEREFICRPARARRVAI